MWLWEVEMHELGLRRRGERFRVCEGRFGLEGHDHITVFSWGEELLPDGRILAEMAEFHVTLYRGGESLHFYYHETGQNCWRHGGHTSRHEIARLGLRVSTLRTLADTAASHRIEKLAVRIKELQERRNELADVMTEDGPQPRPRPRNSPNSPN